MKDTRCLALIAACCLLPAAAPGEGALLSPEMVVDLAHVAELALGPNGMVAYTLVVPRAVEDPPGSSYKELWLSAPGGGEPRRFTSGKERVGVPAFSPDGKLISFLVDRESEAGGAQIWSIPVNGGEARPLSAHDGSITTYGWSPDGAKIAFAATDARGEAYEEDQEAGRDWIVEDEKPRFRHLWIHDLASGESERAYSADLDVASLDWSPDGKSLIFQADTTARTDDEYMRTAIYTLALDAAGSEPNVLTPTVGKLGEMVISPGGRQLAFLGAVSLNDPIAQSLFIVPIAGGEARNLTPDFEASAARLAWPKAGGIVMLAALGEHHALYRVDPQTGERKMLDWPRLVVKAMDVADGRVAFAAESPQHPAELFVCDLDELAPRRLSHHNSQLDEVRLARQEVISWTGADDWTIRGILTFPRDYVEGRRYPLVLQVHGGPEGNSMDGWTTSPGSPVQVLAAGGYMVLQPNYRGSGGRGVAFSKADHDDLGGKEFDDILAGVDSLIERGLVDSERVGTGGWSYGGYMSAWAATRWSDRFKASVVCAGLTNWISFAGTTDIPREMSLVHWNSWWFDEPELHWQRSPMAHLNQASTPTLVVTGAVDERVHPEQARQLYTGLRLKEVPTELVVYPREPHGLRKRAHQLDFIGRTLAWFDEHLASATLEPKERRD